MLNPTSPISFNDEDAMKSVFNVVTPYVQFTTELKALNFESTVLVVHIPFPKSVETRPDYSPLLQAAHNIGEALKTCRGFKVVLLHYVSQPGSVEDLIIPILERVSGKKIGIGFGVAFNAHELTSQGFIKRNIIGVNDACTESCLQAMSPTGSSDTEFVDISTAELIPYWRTSQSHARDALEVEMRRICTKRGADFERLLEITADEVLPDYKDQETSLQDAGLEAIKTLLRLVQDTDTICPVIESLRFSSLKR